MIRSEPLASFDIPLADRQSEDDYDWGILALADPEEKWGAAWSKFADTLFDRPEPTVLSWPCPTCGDHRIKCDCTEVGQ